MDLSRRNDKERHWTQPGQNEPAENLMACRHYLCRRCSTGHIRIAFINDRWKNVVDWCRYRALTRQGYEACGNQQGG